MCVSQVDTEAADILNELQVKLSTVLDNFSAMFAKRYCNKHTHWRSMSKEDASSRRVFFLCLLSLQFPGSYHRLHASDGWDPVPDQRPPQPQHRRGRCRRHAEAPHGVLGWQVSRSMTHTVDPVVSVRRGSLTVDATNAMRERKCRFGSMWVLLAVVVLFI